MMTMQEAIAVMEETAEELGLPMLETLEYVDAHYDEALPEVQRAHRIMMAGFRRLLAA